MNWNFNNAPAHNANIDAMVGNVGRRGAAGARIVTGRAIVSSDGSWHVVRDWDGRIFGNDSKTKAIAWRAAS